MSQTNSIVARAPTLVLCLSPPVFSLSPPVYLPPSSLTAPYCPHLSLQELLLLLDEYWESHPELQAVPIYQVWGVVIVGEGREGGIVVKGRALQVAAIASLISSPPRPA